MVNVGWFRIISWHIAKPGEVSRAGWPKGYCGRYGKSIDVFDDRLEGKTCESCLRIAGPK